VKVALKRDCHYRGTGGLAISKRTFGHAVSDAIDGIRQAFEDQPNFRVQIGLSVVAAALAASLRFNITRWTVLLLTIGFVLAAELFNTCLEHVVDLVQPDSHPLARAAKHAGAGAVLVVSVMALFVGIYLFGGALLQR
jgi:undecaprenol kinase